MTGPVVIAAMAAGMAALAGWGTLPIWQALFVRRGWNDVPGGRKLQSEPIPLAGGFALGTGLVFGAFTLVASAGLLPEAWNIELPVRTLAGYSIGALAMILLGWWDDVSDLRPGAKLSGQLLVASFAVSMGVRLPVLADSPAWDAVASVLYIVGVVNAFNFLDNMNGLCGGLAVIAGAQCAVLAGDSGDMVGLVAGAVLAGAALGFLPHNYPKARAYLGDSGSHAVGFLVAVLVAGLLTRHDSSSSRLGVMLVLAVPLVDLVQVVTGRLLRGKPIYVGDRYHLSHLLVRAGLSPLRAVAVLWGIAAIAGTAGLFIARR